ncbi:MAG TPA: TIGR00730 family Rossman fold protein [Pirellulales bacterium]
MLKSVCVFCGSNVGLNPVYCEAATHLGRTLAERGLRLVYGGGCVGLMGAVADAALAAGGEVFGVIPQALLDRELGHAGLTELAVVASMHERKALMADNSDAFLALPGGFGTFEEFCEVVTWTQLGLHAKPCGLLNVAGFYDPLLALFDRATDDAFIRPAHRRLVLASESADELLDLLAEFRPPAVSKWIDREET